MLANVGLNLLRSILTWINISIRMENVDTLSNWMRFETHPLGLTFLSTWGAGTFMANFVWFLGFCWKQKFIRESEKIFRINVRMFLYSQVLFMFLVNILSFLFKRLWMKHLTVIVN